MGKSLYPWDDWTNGSPWELEANVDFHTTKRQMIERCKDYANRTGRTLRTHSVSASKIVVQFGPQVRLITGVGTNGKLHAVRIDKAEAYAEETGAFEFESICSVTTDPIRVKGHLEHLVDWPPETHDVQLCGPCLRATSQGARQAA